MTEKDTVVLAYSGGLDTSILLKMPQQKYNAEVLTVILDVGQQIDLKAIEKKAENLLKSVIKSYLSSASSKGAKLKSENG